MSIELSVVIVSYNSASKIGACLASLQAQTKGVEYEVIVVDNASRDDTLAVVAREFPWVQTIARRRNTGLSGGNNDGVAASTGRYVAVINPDTRFEHDALTVLVTFLRDHPDVGAVGPRLLDDDGALQLSCRRFPGYATALFNRYSLMTRLFPSNPFSREYLMTDFDHGRTIDVDWLSGAAIMFPRPAFDGVGGWDAGFFMFNEDVDFCRRLHGAGYRVVYHPQATLYHTVGVSKHASASLIVQRHRSMWRYYRKHLRRGAVVDAITAGGIAVRGAFMLAGYGVRRAVRR